MWIQYTNVTDGGTDGRTDTGRQQRPRLRISSRGKNLSNELVKGKHVHPALDQSGDVFFRVAEMNSS